MEDLTIKRKHLSHISNPIFSNERHIKKMNTFIKKLISTSVMFLFTAVAFVVLAFSVVLITVEPLVSQVLLKVAALKRIL
jgi:hypothetical protein